MVNAKTSRNAIICEERSLKDVALDFISAGVGCNCMVVLQEVGLLQKLVDNANINTQDILSFSNPICIQSALVTLEKCKVLENHFDEYSLTDLGRALAEYIGLITIFFDGYGGLIAEQASIVRNEKLDKGNCVKWPIVSKSSIHISENTVDPVLIEECEKLRIQGTICDLGCGHGVMLSKVCNKTGNRGLGFEGNPKTVAEAQQYFINDINIQLELADIKYLTGIWEDVVTLIQAFVFHDITPSESCIRVMDSYLNNFPNLRYFFYIDIVSPSQPKDGMLPGFDYVHGLLGIPTRTYEETIHLFEASKYEAIKEVQIPDLPNTFLWILSPKRRNRNNEY